MENMDKDITVTKWVLINCSKIPQMPQDLSAQIVWPSPKVWNFKKKHYWASKVRGQKSGPNPDEVNKTKYNIDEPDGRFSSDLTWKWKIFKWIIEYKVRENIIPIKFRYSEKATKIWPIFHSFFDIMYLVASNNKWKMGGLLKISKL